LDGLNWCEGRFEDGGEAMVRSSGAKAPLNLLTSALAPRAQQQPQIGAVDDAAAVEVAQTRAVAHGVPGAQQQAQVGAIHTLIVVEIADAPDRVGDDEDQLVQLIVAGNVGDLE
jgi:hypothetical protein